MISAPNSNFILLRRATRFTEFGQQSAMILMCGTRQTPDPSEWWPASRCCLDGRKLLHFSFIAWPPAPMNELPAGLGSCTGRWTMKNGRKYLYIYAANSSACRVVSRGQWPKMAHYPKWANHLTHNRLVNQTIRSVNRREDARLLTWQWNSSQMWKRPIKTNSECDHLLCARKPPKKCVHRMLCNLFTFFFSSPFSSIFPHCSLTRWSAGVITWFFFFEKNTQSSNFPAETIDISPVTNKQRHCCRSCWFFKKKKKKIHEFSKVAKMSTRRRSAP